MPPQQDFGKLPSPFVVHATTQATIFSPFLLFFQFFRENKNLEIEEQFFHKTNHYKMVKRRNNVRAKAARRARTVTRKRHTSLARGVPLDKRGKAFHSNKGQLVIPKGMVLKSKIAQSVPLDMVKKKRDATNQTQTKTTNTKDKK